MPWNIQDHRIAADGDAEYMVSYRQSRIQDSSNRHTLEEKCLKQHASVITASNEIDGRTSHREGCIGSPGE
jgi:hypothetical protein